MNPKTITLIGAGNLAQALGPALRAAGYRIDAVVYRDASSSRKRAAALAKKLKTQVIVLGQPIPDSVIVWLCHTDDALAATARTLARQGQWRNKVVFHSSGALTSDVLSPLRRCGAHTASLHPMMTFVPGLLPRMSEVPFALEGDRQALAVARSVVRKLGAEAFRIGKESKVLYHALGSFSSPMIIATLVTAERVGRAAGLSRIQTRKIMGPILQQTLNNYKQSGAAAAFSGPIKRGDLETVRRHLRELQKVPEAQQVYRALVQSALRDLPSQKKQELLRILDQAVHAG